MNYGAHGQEVSMMRDVRLQVNDCWDYLLNWNASEIRRVALPRACLVGCLTAQLLGFLLDLRRRLTLRETLSG